MRVITRPHSAGEVPLAAFLGAHPEFTLEPPPVAGGVVWGPFLDEDGRFRSWPHRHDADAFFAVRMVRRAGVV